MKSTWKLADKLSITLSWKKPQSSAVFFLYFHITTAFTVPLTPEMWAFPPTK